MSYEAISSQPYENELSNADGDGSHTTEQGSYLLRSVQQETKVGGDALLPDRSSDGGRKEASSHTSEAQFVSSKAGPDPNGFVSQRFEADAGNFMTQWWKELCAILISMAFLIAVYAVLLKIHNTQLRNWSMPFDMQPTTLIAALTTLSRIFLVAVVAEALSQLKWVYFQREPRKLEDIEYFDSASRGAFGSVVFLSKVHWKALAASFGAIITILVLAMEPFAQQALSFSTEPLPHLHQNASIPLATSYDWNSGELTDPSGAQVSELEGSTNTAVIGAMFSGLYNPSNLVNTICPSGNCTWPPFESLGVCASCEDISASVKKQCNYNESIDLGKTVCDYITADGVHLKFFCLDLGSNSDLTLWKSTGNWSGQYYPPNDHPLPRIIQITSIWKEISQSQLFRCEPGSGWEQARPVATQCTFKWCVRRIKGHVRNGDLVEDVLSSTDLSFAKACPSEISDDSGLWTRVKYGESGAVYLHPGFTNANELPEDSCAKDWWRDKPAFWINSIDSSNIFDELSKIFTQTVTSYHYPLLGRILYTVNNKNLTTDAIGVADALTNMIRQGPNRTSWEGTVLTDEVVIKVNWLWLIYPSAVVLIALAFFIITVVRSANGRQIVWKSSSLAMMLHGVEGWTDNTPLRTTSEMKQAARKLWVQLEEDQAGSLRLVGG